MIVLVWWLLIDIVVLFFVFWVFGYITCLFSFLLVEVVGCLFSAARFVWFNVVLGLLGVLVVRLIGWLLLSFNLGYEFGVCWLLYLVMLLFDCLLGLFLCLFGLGSEDCLLVRLFTYCFVFGLVFVGFVGWFDITVWDICLFCVGLELLCFADIWVFWWWRCG